MREDGLVRLLPTEAGLVLRRTEEDPGNNALSLLLLLLLLAVVVVGFLEYLCCCEVDSWFELPPAELSVEQPELRLELLLGLSTLGSSSLSPVLEPSSQFFGLSFFCFDHEDFGVSVSQSLIDELGQ